MGGGGGETYDGDREGRKRRGSLRGKSVEWDPDRRVRYNSIRHTACIAWGVGSYERSRARGKGDDKGGGHHGGGKGGKGKGTKTREEEKKRTETGE